MASFIFIFGQFSCFCVALFFRNRIVVACLERERCCSVEILENWTSCEAESVVIRKIRVFDGELKVVVV